ncbi:MAG: Rieske 2Fe-2S domain-containing protein [Nitrospira sp.]|nr:Rieske 2Fe-2S domain-containing protein [Nitrospira sp.]
MKIIHLSLNSFNSLAVGDTRYFLLQNGAKLVVAPSKCPHRGGPLNLGRRRACTAKLVCPWHDHAYPLHTIERVALPAIRRGNQISVVTGNEEVRVWTELLPSNQDQITCGGEQ